MPSREVLVTLHKYFLNASAAKKHFSELSVPKVGSISESVEHWIYLSLWYGCMRVVIEGWQSLKLADPSVDPLMNDQKIILLNGFRNDVFHFKPDYYSKRTASLLNDPGFASWISKVHDSIGAAILAKMKS